MIKLLIFIFLINVFKRCKIAKSLKKINTPLWAFRAEYVKRKMNRTRKKGHSRKVSLLPYEAFLLRHSSLFMRRNGRIPSEG